MFGSNGLPKFQVIDVQYCSEVSLPFIVSTGPGMVTSKISDLSVENIGCLTSTEDTFSNDS